MNTNQLDDLCHICGAPATDEICDVNAMPDGVQVWVPVCDHDHYAAITEDLAAVGLPLVTEQTGGGLLAGVIRCAAGSVVMVDGGHEWFGVVAHPGTTFEDGDEPGAWIYDVQRADAVAFAVEHAARFGGAL